MTLLGMLSSFDCCSDPEACRAEARRSVRPIAGSVSTSASLATATFMQADNHSICNVTNIGQSSCNTFRCCRLNNAGHRRLLHHRLLMCQHRGLRTEQCRAQYRCVQTLESLWSHECNSAALDCLCACCSLSEWSRQKQCICHCRCNRHLQESRHCPISLLTALIASMTWM